jgi:hypothetical protein
LSFLIDSAVLGSSRFARQTMGFALVERAQDSALSRP